MPPHSGHSPPLQWFYRISPCFQARVPPEHIKKHGTWTPQAVYWVWAAATGLPDPGGAGFPAGSLWYSGTGLSRPRAHSFPPPGTQHGTFKAPGPVPAACHPHQLITKLLCFVFSASARPQYCSPWLSVSVATSYVLHLLLQSLRVPAATL